MSRFKPDHPAIVSGHTTYPSRVRSIPEYDGTVLKPFADNGKLGNGTSIITKGKWKGLHGFYLTLEERATCPKSCHHWNDCYGNNMPFAIRFQPSKEFTIRLWNEVANLSLKHRDGIVIRLHVLGDFYSVEYVRLWEDLLKRFPNVRVFGFTARKGKDPISKEIQRVRQAYYYRFKIRQSMPEYVEDSYAAISVPGGNSITCPVQTGKAKSCATCSLCWELERPVHFLTH